MKWLSYFDSVPPDYYRVSLALIKRVSADVGTGLTAQELSRLSGMSVIVVEDALKWLKKYPEGEPFLKLTKKGTYYNLKLNKYFTDSDFVVPFTYDNTDQSRIAMLEKELTTQRQTTRYSDVSGISESTSPAEAAAIEEIERTLGRAITLTEAYYLGKLMGYGPARVLQIFRSQKRAKEPLRVTYIILTKGKLGSTMVKEQPKKVVYQEL